MLNGEPRVEKLAMVTPKGVKHYIKVFSPSGGLEPKVLALRRRLAF